MNDPKQELRYQLAKLQMECLDVERALDQGGVNLSTDQLLTQRLKRRKGQLKDKISQIEKQILPDIIA